MTTTRVMPLETRALGLDPAFRGQVDVAWIDATVIDDRGFDITYRVEIDLMALRRDPTAPAVRMVSERLPGDLAAARWDCISGDMRIRAVEPLRFAEVLTATGHEIAVRMIGAHIDEIATIARLSAHERMAFRAAADERRAA